VSEIRTEHSDVIAASVSHSHYGFRGQLVRAPDPRSESGELVFNIAVQANLAETRDAYGACPVEIRKVGEPAGSSGINGLGEVNFPTQTIVNGEFGSGAPGVLTVEEPALLALGCFACGSQRRIVNVPRKGGDLAEEQ